MSKITGRTDQPGATAEGWAEPVEHLRVSKSIPAQALNLNVEGKQLTGPLRGFGRMWQKTFRVRLAGATVTPQEVITTWKANFQQFWPPGNYFYTPLTGIEPGEVAVLNLSLPGTQQIILSTGVMVIYADDVSFAVMTPAGHPIAGWITFSSYMQDGTTVVQAESLIRAYDPLYELGDRLGGAKLNDDFWIYTVKAVAKHFGVDRPVEFRKVCVDPKVQWSEAINIRQNAGICTAIYFLTTPVRWLSRARR